MKMDEYVMAHGGKTVDVLRDHGVKFDLSVPVALAVPQLTY